MGQRRLLQGALITELALLVEVPAREPPHLGLPIAYAVFPRPADDLDGLWGSHWGQGKTTWALRETVAIAETQRRIFTPPLERGKSDYSAAVAFHRAVLEDTLQALMGERIVTEPQSASRLRVVTLDEDGAARRSRGPMLQGPSRW